MQNILDLYRERLFIAELGLNLCDTGLHSRRVCG